MTKIVETNCGTWLKLVGPWIHYLEELGVVAKLSDIEYLSIKEFDNKLLSDEGSLTTTGTLATLTADTGKDMYIARAKITFFADSQDDALGDTVELQLNGVVIETSPATLQVALGSTGLATHTYSFENIGHKVTTGQVIRLQVTILDAQTTVEGFIECFEEVTGTSPAIS